MSRKKYKKGIESLKKEINLHRDVKLQKALDNDDLGLAGYYEKEIKRLEDQLIEKEAKLMPRSKRLKGKREKP